MAPDPSPLKDSRELQAGDARAAGDNDLAEEEEDNEIEQASLHGNILGNIFLSPAAFRATSREVTAQVVGGGKNLIRAFAGCWMIVGDQPKRHQFTSSGAGEQRS